MEEEKLSTPDDAHYLGHRKRMKDRFLLLPPEVASDSELLELLLFLVYSRRDVKPLAKQMLKQFGSIRGIIAAVHDKKTLASYGGAVHLLVKLLNEVTLSALKVEMKESVLLSNWQTMIDYLKLRFGNETKEYFTVLFLNVSHYLICTETFGCGTVDESAVYPREIIKKALDVGATSIILCHNHYSGNVQPSKADINITNAIALKCKAVDIEVIDHVIVSLDSHYSFRQNALM
jgi:DNA repair protein RadC